MSGQLAALESERSMAPAPQRSPAGGSPAGGGGMEQHEMLAMLEQTQPMVRRLEGAMGAESVKLGVAPTAATWSLHSAVAK